MGRETNRADSDSNDWQGLGDLIALGSERLITPVKEVHQAITDRWSRLAGPWREPARRTSRAFTTPLYESIRLTGLGVGRAVSFAASTEAGSQALRPLWQTRRGREFQAFINGLWGDELDRLKSNLSTEMRIRNTSGGIISPNRASIAEAFPEPGPRLVVLLHGLGDTEQVWNRKGLGDHSEDGLADILTDNSFTPLLVRYNTGLGVARNALALANLSDEFVEAWPVAVENISFIGHSMGGLVARSALSAGNAAGHNWTQRTTNIVTLGSPHLGAPLEKGVHLAAAGLAQTPESRPISMFLDQRSAGIKDLRFGTVDDNSDHNSKVNYHFVAGTVTNKPDNILGRIVGDLIVPVASATGQSKSRSVTANNVRVLGGRNHRALLRDPVVHQEILSWLSVNNVHLVG